MALFSVTDDWATEEYRGVEEVLDERGVVQTDGAVVHREADGSASCTTGANNRWRVVETVEARRAGFGVCRKCYAPVLSYLADRDDTAVERVGSDVEEVDEEATTAAIADGGLAAIDEGEDGRLASPTEEVLIASKGNRYHAPTGDGPLCKVESDMRRVNREALAGHYPPCTDCFDLDD